jgi:hypothetical protein
VDRDENKLWIITVSSTYQIVLCAFVAVLSWCFSSCPGETLAAIGSPTWWDNEAGHVYLRVKTSTILPSRKPTH